MARKTGDANPETLCRGSLGIIWGKSEHQGPIMAATYYCKVSLTSLLCVSSLFHATFVSILQQYRSLSLVCQHLL